MQNVFQPGSRVVIRHNPHYSGAENIVGIVTEFFPEGGFMRCDLAYVRYTNPRDGSTHEMPFGTANLEPGNPDALIEVAERYEAQAAELRRLAEETRS